MADPDRGQEFWPWRPREGRPSVPGGVLILMLVIAIALAMLLFWLLSGAPSRPPQYG